MMTEREQTTKPLGATLIPLAIVLGLVALLVVGIVLMT